MLANINLAVEEGEFVCIVGSSASGKTTLMKIAAGLVAPDSGSITIGGQAVTSFPRSASIVFQNYSLLPWFSALENVRLGVESAFLLRVAFFFLCDRIPDCRARQSPDRRSDRSPG